jgi:hypothetical protein
MIFAVVTILSSGLPPTGLTTAVERVTLDRRDPEVRVTVDPLNKAIELTGATVRGRLESHLCPSVAKTAKGSRLSCTTRRLWAAVEEDEAGLFLDLRALRGVSWRWEPDAIPFTAWTLGELGIPETCPGVTEAAQAECALADGRLFEAEALYTAALAGPDAHLARLRLGDFALHRGDSEAALRWYSTVASAGPVARVAAMRACDLTGICLSAKQPSTAGLTGTSALEAEIHLIRQAAAINDDAEAMRRLSAALERGSPICATAKRFCQKLVQSMLSSTDETARTSALSTFASAALSEGPLGVDVSLAAAQTAESIGAPQYAASVLASVSSKIPREELDRHLQRVVRLYLVAKQPIRAQFIVEYAEQKLPNGTLASREWRRLRQLVAPAPARPPSPPTATLTERLPSLAEDVNLTAELARAAHARSTSATSGAHP